MNDDKTKDTEKTEDLDQEQDLNVFVDVDADLDVPELLSSRGKLFGYIFGRPEALADMYQQLSGEPDKRSPDEIEILDVEGFIDPIWFGRAFFKLKGKIVIFIMVTKIEEGFLEDLGFYQTQKLMEYMEKNSLTKDDLNEIDLECYVVVGDLDNNADVEVYSFNMELE